MELVDFSTNGIYFPTTYCVCLGTLCSEKNVKMSVYHHSYQSLILNFTVSNGLSVATSHDNVDTNLLSQKPRYCHK